MGKLPHCWVDPWTSSRGQRTCCCFLHLGALFCLPRSRWGLPTAGGDPPLLAPMLNSPADTLIGTPAIVFNLFSGHTETNTKWTLTGNVGLERPKEIFLWRNLGSHWCWNWQRHRWWDCPAGNGQEMTKLGGWRETRCSEDNSTEGTKQQRNGRQTGGTVTQQCFMILKTSLHLKSF